MITLKEYNKETLNDCLAGIIESDGNSTNPYVLFTSRSYGDSKNIRCTFPDVTDDFGRVTQYHFALNIFSIFRTGYVSLVSFMEQPEIPSMPEIPEGLWGTDGYVALVGSANTKRDMYGVFAPEESHSHPEYEVSLIIFNNVDGDLLYTTIEDTSDWSTYIDNVAPFRDLLFCSASEYSHKNYYSWLYLYKLAEILGFEFDFYEDDIKTEFILEQQVTYSPFR